MFSPYGSRSPDWLPLGDRIHTTSNGASLMLEGKRNVLNGFRRYILSVRGPLGEAFTLAKWNWMPLHPVVPYSRDYLAADVVDWIQRCVDSDTERAQPAPGSVS